MSKYQAFIDGTLAEGATPPKGGVEAHGTKGMKSTPWRKTFKSQADFDKWLEKNGDDVTVQGTRDLNEAALQEAQDPKKLVEAAFKQLEGRLSDIEDMADKVCAGIKDMVEVAQADGQKTTAISYQVGEFKRGVVAAINGAHKAAVDVRRGRGT